MSKILVTGGAGFIGSHLVDALVKKEHRVIVVDDLSVGKRKHISKKAIFYKRKVQSQNVQDIFRRHRFDFVYHLAAQKNLQISKDTPENDAETNVIGGLRLLTAAKKNGVKKFIFYSTAAVYDPVAKPGNIEKEIPHPVTPYGISKYAFEQYLSHSGLPYSILRLSNVYGPRQDVHGEGGVVAIFAPRLLEKKQCTINNTGRQTRDFIYVDDVVSASIKAMCAGTNMTLNVSTGKETTINELYSILATIARYDRPTKQASLLEQFRSALRNRKAKKELHWEPRIDLYEGLQKTYNWFNENDGK